MSYENAESDVVIPWTALASSQSKIDFKSQILAFFDTFPTHQFSKFNNFLWVFWFLGKNISNFVPQDWKLDNLYYNTMHTKIVLCKKARKKYLSHCTDEWPNNEKVHYATLYMSALKMITSHCRFLVPGNTQKISYGDLTPFLP